MKNIVELRSQFPSLQNNIQLSSCSQSAMHIDVKNSVHNYMTSWEERGMDWELWVNACEESRRLFAKMINAEVDEIAIVSSVSHAISAVLTSLEPTHLKNEAIVSTMDFPCIGQSTLSQGNYNVKYIQPTIEAYEKNITEKTIISSAPYVSFYNGERLNIEEITKIAHKKGSLLFVDAYQAAGQIDIDVKKLNVDFLASGMQKYMLGMPGIAFLYVKKEIANEMTPKITGWFGQMNPFAFNGQEVEYAKGARRFDSGTFPMINGFSSKSAIDVLLTIGIPKIERYLFELSTFTLEYCREKGLEIASPLDAQNKGSNTAIRVINANEVEKQLKERHIIVSARNDVIRIAPHFYNTKEDVALAVDELAKLTVISSK